MSIRLTAYYNENDRFACDWLSNLMDAELITPGKIDDRSIHDVRPDDLAGYERVHFFAGIGGWDRALNRAGWRRPVWTGSCPCQPFSSAGHRKGFADDRHLWPTWRELIRERRPTTIFGEQVASASDWLRLVRGDLEALGFAVGAIPFQAASAGADHLRDRYGFVAYADNSRLQGWPSLPERADQRSAGADGVAHTDGSRNAYGMRLRLEERQGLPDASRCDGGEPDAFEWVIGADGKTRRVKSGVRLLVDAFPNRVGLLRGFGNAIDPEAFAQFIGAADEAINMTSTETVCIRQYFRTGH